MDGAARFTAPAQARARGRAALVVALACSVAAPARADVDCAVEADRLRAHLVTAETGARRWNVAWAILFGTAAAGQVGLALAEYNPLGEFDRASEETMYVGAAKATIGFATRIIMPVRVSIPSPQADRCEDLGALRAELARIAKKQRRTFWLTHLGGTALNLAGAGLLWSRHDLATGALSFAISYPVGVISAYTLPRASWHAWRDQRTTWTVALVPRREGTTLSIAGTF